MFAEKPVIGAEDAFEELLDGSGEGNPTINIATCKKTPERQKGTMCIQLHKISILIGDVQVNSRTHTINPPLDHTFQHQQSRLLD